MENRFVVCFSTFRILHVNMNSFEMLKKKMVREFIHSARKKKFGEGLRTLPSLVSVNGMLISYPLELFQRSSFRHLLAASYIMPFTERKNCTWNGFYESLNFRQIGLQNSSFFLPTFQFPRFLTMFPCSDLFYNGYEYSLDQYLDIFFLGFSNSGFLVFSLLQLMFFGASVFSSRKVYIMVYIYIHCTLRNIYFHIFSNWMEYGLADKFVFVLESSGNPFVNCFQLGQLQKEKYFRNIIKSNLYQTVSTIFRLV